MVKLALIATAVLAVTHALPLEPKSLGNTGVIPGTNITVYDMRDPVTWKPISYESYTDNVLPGLPPMSGDVKHVSERLTKREDGFDNRMYLRKWCVPQVSINPMANPYHEDLVGKKGINSITGASRPILFPDPGIDCPKSSPAPCTIQVSHEITYQNAFAYSVTDSDSNSVVKTVGGSSSITHGSSTSDTVSHTIEKSWSEADTHTDEQSTADTTGYISTTGWSNASNNVTINSKDEHSGNGTSEIDEHNGNWHASGSADMQAGIPPFFSVSAHAEAGGGGGWSNSKGSTTDKSTTHGSAYQGGASRDDNFSNQTHALTTGTTGSSDSHTSTTGGSDSDTNSHMETTSVDITETNDWSTSTGHDHGTEQGNTTTTTNITSNGIVRTYSVAPGECMKLACIPVAEMTILPFICADTETNIAERAHAAIARLQQKDRQIGCFAITLVSCYDAIQDSMPFVTYDTTIQQIGLKNVLRVGDVLDSSNGLISNNGLFTATVEADGNFVVWRNTIKVWQSGGTPFKSIPSVTKYKHRIRINARGHLVRETANMWSKVNPPFIPDTFVPSWGTQPIYNNYTVGSPRRGESTVDDYLLILDDNGRLSLYDAAYIKTWCTFDSVGSSCPNSKGFIYQDYYLVPTDYVTPRVIDEAHNDLSSKIPLSKSSVMSLDAECSAGLMSGNGMVSPNGRFKLILEENGNLLVKDDYRTMWQSFSGNMTGSVKPYRLFVTDEGHMAISDKNLRWVWYAQNDQAKNAGPYKMSITDAGKFVVTSVTGEEVWESWPQRNRNAAFVSFDNIRNCYKPCGECVDTIAPTKTITTATTTTPLTSPTVNPNSVADMCGNLMKDYNMDPFGSWGQMEGKLDLQAKWQFYDCSCFGANSKYNIGLFDDKWGTLKDAAIKKQYIDSACNCPVAQDKYKVLPLPKNWGSMSDSTLKTGWARDGCDEDTNREPYIHNPVGGPSTTITSVTSTTTSSSSAGTIYPTVMITTGYTVVPDVPTIPPYTPTATATPAPTCSGGKPGKNDGSGTSGQCCKKDADCQENCKGGKCGTCGKDFAC
jgi:hypothetical protein